MNLTCAQMDILITFYIEEELSKSLKKQVEEHLENCSNCRAKYDIVKTMISDLKKSYPQNDSHEKLSNETTASKNSEQYRHFQTNLSAYIDSELPSNESLKLKKFTISNDCARKELEENYNLRKLMNSSFQKTKEEIKQDFSKNIIKQLELDNDDFSGFHPAIKLLIGFTLTVLVLTAMVLISLSV